jgi:uncharacterized membrane protein
VIPGRATILIVSVCAAAHFAAAQPKVFGVQTDGTAPRDLATDVAALVAERCAPCHSPAHPDAASEPRALRKWAGATDLAAVIETVVVPGTPDESDLYLSVELDEMPPADSASAPLTADEKALIHGWITAGAPLPTAPAAVQEASETPAPSALELIGRFHPLAVHFPIALLLAALPAALWARWRRSTPWAMCADYCTALGALGAVLASALGWCAHEAGAGALHPDLLERHEWSGFAAAFLALLALGAAVAARRGHRFGRWHLPLLGAAVAVVSAAGHFGGMLVWGEDFLPLPF